ncbi:MAG: HAMP domain-containing sensor histidine kinase [Cytophagales bacterium]|nr:HAMP domain-containing histidine kinase [Bernardetiaceae bacterium]MDW8205144.1 HAMP domain-containing sensor histidine kinase [Cytophagales bacterium]
MASPETALLQELIEQYNYPVVLCTADGTIRYANREANQLIASGKLVGQSVIWADPPYIELNHEKIVLEEQPLQSKNLRWLFLLPETQLKKEKLLQIPHKWDKILQELADRNYELDEFIHRVSHDIRAPLTTLLGLIDIMRNIFLHNPEMLKELLEKMEITIKKLDRYVENLHDYLKNNRQDVRIEPIDIEELLDECLSDLSYLPNFARVRVFYDLPARQVPFQSDRTRLTIILRNLFSNAIKFANVYKNDNHLKISVQVTSEEAIFTVQDNGIGIKPELANQVFDMFFRTDAHAYGAGLGLYIVKKAVERMGGTIAMQSCYGQGTTFTVTLPNHA